MLTGFLQPKAAKRMQQVVCLTVLLYGQQTFFILSPGKLEATTLSNKAKEFHSNAPGSLQLNSLLAVM